MIGKDCFPVCNTTDKFIPNPNKITAYCKIFIDWDEVTSHLPPIDMEKVFAELAKSDSEFYQGRKMGENE